VIWFLIIVSLTNIALGYGLAVYLGHGQFPWKAGSSVAHLPSTMPTTPLADPAELPTLDDNAGFSNLDEDTAEELDPIEDNQSLDDEQDTDEVEPTETNEDAQDEVDEGVTEEEEAIESDTPDEVNLSKVTENDSSEPLAAESLESDSSVEEDLAEEGKEIDSQAPRQAESSSETSTREETTDNLSEQEPSTESTAKESGEPSEVIEDEILDGLESFRTQLTEMQQQLTEPSEDAPNEAVPETNGTVVL